MWVSIYALNVKGWCFIYLNVKKLFTFSKGLKFIESECPTLIGIIWLLQMRCWSLMVGELATVTEIFITWYL